jgi:surface polysaccharide O-acyltransferase-like enzyme
LHYALYFFAGAGLGAYGIERGLLGPDGALIRYWRVWLGLALGSFALWLGVTALVVESRGPVAISLRIIDDLSFVVACLCNTFGVLALGLRFAASRRGWLDNLKESAFGIYLVHYVFVIWLQYALLPADLPGIVKAVFVFAGTVSLSWGITAGARHLRAFIASSMAGGPGAAARLS